MVRDKNKSKAGITELEYNEMMFTEDIDKAECLNGFFSSVFTREDTRIIPRLQEKESITVLESLEVTETQVKKLLAKLKTDKSPGPDCIHNKVIYEAREQLLSPLTELFRSSIKSGEIPPEWKMADVVPIFKKG